MNEVTVFVYLVFFVGLFGATFAFMWKMMTSTLESFNNLDKPIKRTKHPEMKDVKNGDELLVFRPLEDPDDK